MVGVWRGECWASAVPPNAGNRLLAVGLARAG